MAQPALATVTDMDSVTYEGNSHLHLSGSFELPLYFEHFTVKKKGTESGLQNLLPPPPFFFF